MEDDKIGTDTFANWKAHFSAARGDEITVISDLDGLDASTRLTRVWTPAEGPAPKDVKRFGQKVWANAARSRVKPGIVLLRTPAKPSMVFLAEGAPLPAEDAKPKQPAEKKAKKAKSKREVDAPEGSIHLWRCRMCAHMMEASERPIHCDYWMRQMRETSKQGRKMLQDFLDGATWEHVPLEETWFATQPSTVRDAAAREFANEAGAALATLLGGMEMKIPDHFELYDSRTDHLRVSDLKERKKFVDALKSAEEWHGKVPRPKGGKKLPIMIEIGHLFDELLSSAFERSEHDDWAPGQRIHIDVEELGLRLAGTPDLLYRQKMVEMKTVKFLARKQLPKAAQNNAKTKLRMWRKQVGLYLAGAADDYLLLLVISRDDGAFTVVPMDDTGMTARREQFTKWSRDSEIKPLLEGYKSRQ